MPVVQPVTISGQIIEKGRWEVTTLVNLREGQSFTVSVPVKDRKLIKYMSKQDRMDCVLERDGKKKYWAILQFTVSHFKHMLEPPKKIIESMVFVIPHNRTVENVFLAAIGSDKVNPKFTELLKGS